LYSEGSPILTRVNEEGELEIFIRGDNPNKEISRWWLSWLFWR
jgi:hypothetical protein